MATNDGDVFRGWVGVFDFRDESAGTDDVEGCYTEEAFWVVDAGVLEYFGGDWDGGVDLNFVNG